MSESPRLADLSAAERHRHVAAVFTDHVRGTIDWNAPAPVEGWTARDVVGHLVTWLPDLLASGSSVRLPAGPGVEDDTVGAWETQTLAVQAVLDDPSYAEVKLTNPHFGSMPVVVAIDQFYTSDVFMHAWDLARATGRAHGLDDEHAGHLLAGMQPIEEMLRSSGQYGAAVPVAADAPAVDRLMAFVGRDPSTPA